MLVFILSPGPALCSVPKSSTKLRLFSHPIVFVLYLFVNYTFYYISFFPSLTLLIQMVSFVSLSCTCWKFFHSRNIFLQSSTDDYTSPSLLLYASPQLTGTMLLRLIIAHTPPYTNPILQFLAVFFCNLDQYVVWKCQ